MDRRLFVIGMNKCFEDLKAAKGDEPTCHLVLLHLNLKALKEYKSFIELSFKQEKGFSTEGSLPNQLVGCGFYWLEESGKMTFYFLRSLLLLQFKEHCLETKLYETF